jgi:hypothetical protein
VPGARALVVSAIALLVVAGGRPARAQELEPRAYSPSPLGTNFFAAALGRLSGDVLFDPTVPVTDVHADIDVATIGYGRTFGFAGHLCAATAALPVAVAHVTGQVQDAARSVHRQGFADARLRVSIDLTPGSAMTPEEFAKARRKTVVGLSLTVQTPNGQYDPARLINLGTNRWAFKPEIGVAVPFGRWSLEAYGGAWLFSTNDAFYPGSSAKYQKPLTSLQAHVSYTFVNRLWLALDGTWYGGGETSIDTGPLSSRYSNARLGGVISVPIAPRQSIKISASHGTTVRTGTDFTSLVVGWQLVWFDKPSPPSGRNPG